MSLTRPSANWKRLGPAVLALGLLVTGYGLSLFVPAPWHARRGRALPQPIGPLLGDAPTDTEAFVPGAASNSTELITALGYTEGTIDEHPENIGTLLHESESYPGVNFYTSRKVHAARLIDDAGNLLHSWTHAWGPWQHAHLFPNGDVLTVVQDQRLFELDSDSKLLWTLPGRFHHDLWVDGDGRIYCLQRKGMVVDRIHPRAKTLVDFLTVVSAEGVELESHSLVDIMLDSPYAFVLPSVRHRPTGSEEGEFDILHANHVEVFDGALAERSPLFAKGNLLVSLRNINAIVILSARAHQVLWLWGPSNVSLQHHPTLLDNGHILLFNNGVHRSSVLELDPLTLEIAWEYRHDDFYSATRGSVQRLGNGNTLITESDAGYVFEVTPAGRVVWQFANPDVSADGLRSSIWRMTRFDPRALDF